MTNEPATITKLPASGTRLRVSPTTRFRGPQHSFDLLALSAHLLNEEHGGANGHRQVTIFRHEATTMVLFAFEAGGGMDNHKANGLVTMHLLDGSLTVEVEDQNGPQTHDLRASQLLVLSPGVRHSILAHEASRMLLTVQLATNPKKSMLRQA